MQVSLINLTIYLANMHINVGKLEYKYKLATLKTFSPLAQKIQFLSLTTFFSHHHTSHLQIKISEQSNATVKAAPSKRVDELWHAHILSTKEYQQFCERHNNGNFIHHDPSIPDSPDRYQITWMKYMELFKSEPKDRSIWPYPAEEEYSSEEGEGWDPGCG